MHACSEEVYCKVRAHQQDPTAPNYSEVLFEFYFETQRPLSKCPWKRSRPLQQARRHLLYRLNIRSSMLRHIANRYAGQLAHPASVETPALQAVIASLGRAGLSSDQEKKEEREAEGVCRHWGEVGCVCPASPYSSVGDVQARQSIVLFATFHESKQ